MRKYLIIYNTHEGDTAKVWCEAEDKGDAEDNAKEEHHDIKEVISISVI